MARYRIDEQAGVEGGYAGDELMVLFTVLLSLAIGAALVWISWRGRQIWLLTWSAGLIVASVAYLGWVALY